MQYNIGGDILDKISGIYFIKNKINNKIYIGSSIDLKRRISAHKYLLKNNKHYNLYLQRAWNKNTFKNFEFIIFETFDDIAEKELREKEENYIKNFKSLYNQNGYNINSKTDIVHCKYKKVCKFNLKGELVAIYDSLLEAFENSTDKSASAIYHCCNGFIKYSNGYTYRYYDNFEDKNNIKIEKINLKKENISYKKRYDFSKDLKNNIILCYSLKGNLLFTFKNVEEAHKELNVSKCSLFNRLKENNVYNEDNTYYYKTLSNYIFIRWKIEDIFPEKIVTNVKFLYKIEHATNIIVKEYEYNKRKLCAKELNISPCNLDRYIQRKKIIDGYYYKWIKY